MLLVSKMFIWVIMRVLSFHVRNFRRLKDCRIDLAEKETIFVGANNSGKTAAIDALRFFLKEREKFTTNDFTLCNWWNIDEIGNDWLENEQDDKQLSPEKWKNYVPQMDLEIDVKKNEIHYVNKIIPTLDWTEGKINVRLSFEPKNIEKLHDDYCRVSERASKLISKESQKKGKEYALKVWPQSLTDFLKKRLSVYFTVQTYIFNPVRLEDTDKDSFDNFYLLGDNPLKGLIRIDIIRAQRESSEADGSESKVGNLSSQFRKYYEEHIGPKNELLENDLEALKAVQQANELFEASLAENFSSPLSELQEINYPGFGNPKIIVSSKIKYAESLNHEAAVQFDVLKEPIEGKAPLRLAERYNGLGYQNLITMVFKLMRFREDWMREDKGESGNEEDFYEPLQIVLMEEPEAHLHVQVQQVFMRKAYEVLRKHDHLGDNPLFTTQLVVSTHSSCIAHETSFANLRYFKREVEHNMPTSCVVNLSEVFGGGGETEKFVKRYLKTTHCDLFFADAAILVEGPAERILVPYFIKSAMANLYSSYISLLEIGGSHAHTLQPLIEKLGLLTLIITDIDSCKNGQSVAVKRKQEQESNNDTLKRWLPKERLIDKLLDMSETAKESDSKKVRVAYQTPFKVKFGDHDTPLEVLPYTFEDALVFSNIELFRNTNGNGLMKKFKKALNMTDLKEAEDSIWKSLRNGEKAKFALDLLYLDNLKDLKMPQYIREGLEWLSGKLNESNFSIINGIGK